MQSLPGSALEVIETEFFFQLLVRLLANPSCLDCSGQGARVSLRRRVGEIVFLLRPTSCVRRRAQIGCAQTSCCIAMRDLLFGLTGWRSTTHIFNTILSETCGRFGGRPLVYRGVFALLEVSWKVKGDPMNPVNQREGKRCSKRSIPSLLAPCWRLRSLYLARMPRADAGPVSTAARSAPAWQMRRSWWSRRRLPLWWLRRRLWWPRRHLLWWLRRPWCAVVVSAGTPDSGAASSSDCSRIVVMGRRRPAHHFADGGSSCRRPAREPGGPLVMG
jgi:hypothetical protein